MNSTQIVFNEGGSLTVTPASDEDLDVTLKLGQKSATFTTTWDTDVDTTVDAFVAEHALEIARRFTVYVGADASTATALEVYNVRGLQVTSDNGTVGDVAPEDEFSLNIGAIAQIMGASDTSVVLNMNASSVPAASDVVTVNFVSVEDRKYFRERYNEITRASKRGLGNVALDVAHKATTA